MIVLDLINYFTTTFIRLAQANTIINLISAIILFIIILVMILIVGDFTLILWGVKVYLICDHYSLKRLIINRQTKILSIEYYPLLDSMIQENYSFKDLNPLFHFDLESDKRANFDPIILLRK